MKNMNLRKLFETKDIIIGTWHGLPASSVADVLAHTDLDFIVIDAEHGPVSYDQAENHVRACQAQSVIPMMRVTKLDESHILRALDIGCAGVHIPHITSRQDAQRAVEAVKYYPLGQRGYTPFTKAGGYGRDVKDYVAHTNEQTSIVAHIEGEVGVSQLDEIVMVSGLDVIFLGPYDLSQSLGCPGDVNHPKVWEALRHCVDLCRKYNLICGSFAHDIEMAKRLIQYGVRYLTFSVDSVMLRQTYQNALQQIKNIPLKV